MHLATLLKRTLNGFGYDIKYHRPFFETIVMPLGIRTVLDIGANEGLYAKDMAARFPDATIHAFEPLKDCFERLAKVASAHSAIVPHHMALGAEGGKTVIHKSSAHQSSSLLPMTSLHKHLYPKSAESIDEEITISRLDEVPDILIREPMFVKIDVQGFEGAVIDGGQETLKRASVIVVENSYMTLYEGQLLFTELAEKLSRLGFAYIGSVHTHHSKRTGRPLYEDSAFVKKDILERWIAEETGETRGR
jgi:FkbM family methyltransferase